MVLDPFTYTMTLEPYLLLHDFAYFFVRSGAGRWSNNGWLGAGSSASSLTLQFVVSGLGGAKTRGTNFALNEYQDTRHRALSIKAYS